MKRKNTKNKSKKTKKGKIVTLNTYQLMFGNEPPTYISTKDKYLDIHTPSGKINGKIIIK